MKFLFKNSKFTNSKLGAMFGLDARIALAIFGALSVITGVALYSVLGNVQNVQYMTQTKEIEKAIEQYMLDTGKMLPLDANHPEKNLDIKALIKKPSGVNGWKGPYLSYTEHVEGWITDGKDTIAIEYKSEPWIGSWGVCTKTSERCLLFVLFLNDHNKNLVFEKYIDKTENPGDSDFTGKFYYDKSWIHTWGMNKTQIPFDPKRSPNI